MPETKLPAIKNIPAKTDPELKGTLDSMKEALEVRLGRRGDPKDRAITLRELIDSGLAKGVKTNIGGATGTDFVPPDEEPPGDLSVPPAPTGLEASGSFTQVILDWNIASYSNHAYTEIWRSEANALGGAVLRSTTNAFVYTDEVGYGKTYYYWVKFVSTSNVEGPFNATEGTDATTAVDVGAVMTSLSEELKQLPGFNTLTSDLNVTLGSTTATLQATLESINTSAATANTNVASLTTNTPRVLRATSSPTQRSDGTSLQAGDIWMDTDNGNEIFVYTGSTWAASTAGSTSSSDTTLQTQITANGNSISQNASDLLLVAGVSDRGDISSSVNITTLNSSITNGTTGLAANASAIGALTTRVTSAEGTITSQSGSITALNNILNGYSGTNAVANAVSGLQTQITNNDTDIAAKASAADVTALTTTVGTKVKTFVATSAPTATAIGDLWIDSDDNNKLYRASATGSSNWVAVNDTSGITVFAQTAEPTGVNAGDLWFDTDDNNKQYRYSGSAWVAVDDSRITSNATAVSNLSTAVGLSGSSSTKITTLENALSGYTGSGAVSSALSALTSSVTGNDNDITAINSSITSLTSTVNAKTQTFVATSAPTAISVGDIWIDSDDGNKMYRASATGASNWVAVNDTSGIAVYAQTAEPTGTNTGDLWFDTDDSNKQYRYNGSAWVAVVDTRVASNASAISNLTTAVGLSGSSSTKITALENTVNHGTTGVAASATAINNLTTEVNAIPVQFYQATAPSSGHVTGDYWIDSDDDQLYRYNGSAWESIRDNLVTSSASAISSLQTDVAGNTANIASNATAISTETTARTNAINQVSATAASKNQTFIQTSAPTAITVGDLWIDSDDSNKLYRATATGTSNWVAVGDTSNDSKATIFTQSSVPTSISSGDLWIDTDNNDKVYRANGAGANSIVTSGNGWYAVGIATEASVTTVSSAVADINGNAASSYVLQVAANGSVAGMVIEANASDGGTASAVQFVADKFAIWNDVSASTSPFTVSGGVVYIKDAMIQNGAITSAKIGSAAIETAKIDNAAITTAKIADANITTAKIGDAQITNAKINDLNADKITAGLINSARINVDTLAVKSFDNVSSTIVSHLGAGTKVPLSVEASAQSWSGTYPGSTIVSSETSSVVNFGCTTTNVRNNAKYRVIYSAVLGNVRKGTIQYSYDQSTWVSLSPTVNANAGTYRTYVFVWDGQITGLGSTQSTVYWRINWNVTGGQVNSTYAALYVTLDNTQ